MSETDAELATRLAIEAGQILTALRHELATHRGVLGELDAPGQDVHERAVVTRAAQKARQRLEGGRVLVVEGEHRAPRGNGH